jgi:serine/threonine protein kinase
MTISTTTSALIPYMVLEWLDGKPLSDELAQRRNGGCTGRPLADAVRLLDSAADALAYAHAQGIVHRDFNPGNLFLANTQSGVKLKVLDFGVAKIMTDSALALAPLARTLGNVRMFTPAYGAPEQFDERSGSVGPWTDVYAMALVVMEVLRDCPVMAGESLGDFASSALSASSRPTPRAHGLSLGRRVDEVLTRAVALSPSERPQDAGEFWGMLKNAMLNDEASASPRDKAHVSPSLAPGHTGPSGTLVMSQSVAAAAVPGDAARVEAQFAKSTPDGVSMVGSAAPQTSLDRSPAAIAERAHLVTVPIVRRRSWIGWLLLAVALVAALAVALWFRLNRG